MPRRVGARATGGRPSFARSSRLDARVLAALGAVGADDAAQDEEEDGADHDGRQQRPEHRDPVVVHASRIRGAAPLARRAVARGSSPAGVGRRASPVDRSAPPRRPAPPRSCHDHHREGRQRGGVPDPRPPAARLPRRPAASSSSRSRARARSARCASICPTRRPGADVDCAASTLIGMVCKVAAADAVAVVAYTDARVRATTASRTRDLVAGAPRRRADACGLRVVDALCVARRRVGVVPRPGLPATAAGRSPSSASSRRAWTAFPDAGRRPAVGDRAARTPTSPRRSTSRGARARSTAAVDLLCGADDGRRRRRRGIRRRDEARRRLAASTRGRSRRCARSTTCPTLFEQALDVGCREPRTRTTPRRSIWCLSRPALRDIALVQWCGGLAAGDEALDAQLRWEAGEEYPAHLAMHMWGEGERPDAGPARARRSSSLAASPPRRRAPSAPGVLATCGVAGVGARPLDPRRRTTPRSRARSSPSTGSARSCARSCTPGTCRSGRSTPAAASAASGCRRTT